MNQGIVIGNWKMHGSKSSVEALLQALRIGFDPMSKTELAVLVPSVFLDLTQRLLTGSKIAWGAQVLSEHSDGPYTGEISASMLLDFGCRYVLVGHSERRSLYGETDTVVALKFAAAAKAGLTPILCVGETLTEREKGQPEQVIQQQLDTVMGSEEGLVAMQRHCLIAYEPVWAIGTGLAASPEQAQTMHAAIREHIASYDKGLAVRLQILYGGSMKAANAAALFAMPDINGGLIGGASLNAAEFLEMSRLCNNY